MSSPVVKLDNTHTTSHTRASIALSPGLNTFLAFAYNRARFAESKATLDEFMTIQLGQFLLARTIRLSDSLAREGTWQEMTTTASFTTIRAMTTLLKGNVERGDYISAFIRLVWRHPIQFKLTVDDIKARLQVCTSPLCKGSPSCDVSPDFQCYACHMPYCSERCEKMDAKRHGTDCKSIQGHIGLAWACDKLLPSM